MLGICAASVSTISTLYGFSTMSFLVAVMPAPSASLMMPLSWSRSSARASLVVSLGTAIWMVAVLSPESSLLEPQPVRARAAVRTSARTSAVSLIECFFIVLFSLLICNNFFFWNGQAAGSVPFEQQKNSGRSLTFRCRFAVFLRQFLKGNDHFFHDKACTC